jgi:integrase
MEKGEKKRPRRPDGEGTITRRADGRYQGAYYLKNGERRFVYHARRNECAALLREAIARVARGEQEKSRKTVDVWLVEWLDNVKSMNYRANSYQNRYYPIHNRLAPRFKGILLVDLDVEEIERWIREMVKEGLEASTIHTYHGILDAALRNAVKKRMLPYNPCDAIELPHIEKKEAPTLNLEEAHQLLKQINGHWIEPIILTLLGTGMRLGEVLSLKWTEVDLVGNTILVCRNVAYVQKGAKTGFVEGPPKTESSKRVIALAGFVASALKTHRRAQKELRLSVGSIWTDNDLVFPNEKGGYRHEGRVEYHLRQAMIRAGLNPAITPHKLRHSTGSILNAMGIDPKVIQEILGHSSIGQTMDVYVHTESSAQAEAMRQLDAKFERSKEAQ